MVGLFSHKCSHWCTYHHVKAEMGEFLIRLLLYFVLPRTYPPTLRCCSNYNTICKCKASVVKLIPGREVWYKYTFVCHVSYNIRAGTVCSGVYTFTPRRTPRRMQPARGSSMSRRITAAGQVWQQQEPSTLPADSSSTRTLQFMVS